MGGCSQFMTLQLCHSFLTFFPCSRHGSSPWLQSFRINLLQHQLSTGCSLLQCISSCCGVGSSTSHSMGICSGMVLSTGCREMPAAQWSPPGAAGDLCSAYGAPPPALTAGLFLTLFSSLLFLSHCCTAFLPFLNCLPRGTTTVAEVLSCALQWVHWSQLELAVSSARQSKPLLTEAALQPPPLPHKPNAIIKMHKDPFFSKLFLKTLGFRSKKIKVTK